MATHLAAHNTAKGTPLVVESRQTPDPENGQVLIDVRAVALNIVDAKMRDLGFGITQYPAVLGSDISGVIVKTGPCGVPDFLQVGTRVTAFASGFYHGGDPKYGAFQERVLVGANAVCPIPNDIDYDVGATLGIVNLVPLSAWEMFGFPLTGIDAAGNKHKAILIWSAATGIGTMAVQQARILEYHVIATASPSNHEYIRSLGADVVFDYHDPADVEKEVVRYVKDRKLELKHCFFSFGELSSVQSILKTINGADGGSHVAHAPPLFPGTPMVDGVEVNFIQPSGDPEEREAQIARWFNVWLKEKLASGEIKPSPPVKIVGKGLEGINGALEDLDKNGIKCAKPVVVLHD